MKITDPLSICKQKSDRKGRPYKRSDANHIRRGDLYGRPFCTGHFNT